MQPLVVAPFAHRWGEKPPNIDNSDLIIRSFDVGRCGVFVLWMMMIIIIIIIIIVIIIIMIIIIIIIIIMFIIIIISVVIIIINITILRSGSKTRQWKIHYL